MLHQFLSSRGHRGNQKLLNQVLHYLCRSYGPKMDAYHRAFASVGDFAGKDSPAVFRTQIFGNQKVCMNLRYYLYHCAFNYSVAKAALLLIQAKQYGVSLRDAKYCLQLVRDKQQRRTVLQALAAQGISARQVKPACLAKDIEQGRYIITDLQESVAKNCQLKLAWIAKAHSIPVSDFFSEVSDALLVVHYMSMPTTRSDVHQYNRLCSALHSRIKNINNKHSAECRKRQIQVGENEFESMEIRAVMLSTGESTMDCDSFEAQDDKLRVLEFKRSCSQLLRSSRAGSKRWSLYSTLFGAPTQSFLNYFNKIRTGSRDFTQWMAQQDRPTLIQHFSNWLGIAPSRVQYEFQRVAEHVL